MKKLIVENRNKYGRVTKNTVLVDDEDAYLLRSYAWTIKPDGQVVRRVNGVSLPLSKVVLGITNNKTRVYHKNSNPLDNRKENLSPIDIRGWTFTRNGYQVMVGGKYIGRFTSEKEAEDSYKKNLPETLGKARY